MTYRLLSPAAREIQEAAEYYESKVPGLGSDFIDELEVSISRILQFPEAWGLIRKPFRHCMLRRFPYSIIYTLVEGGGVLIVSAFHQHREPLSWRSNMG